MVDALLLANQIVPYVTAAVGSYGTAVLTRASGAGADATVSLGTRILQRIWRREDSRADIERAVRDAVAAPEDEDFQAALRAQIKRALRDDAELAAEIAGLLPQAGASVSASGDGAVAAQRNEGVISTGDNATIQR
ncbi:hypothetical protein [Streptomyces beijiangensis]|uniref:Uncharacterized protein n=1 Tax=Streptomyces beijiangensis TaxID=163361 RepID=A0A939FFZ4_9ACTN|nr:hypothetical protein [Streptomyces beijiangensis]MBO0517404.1 hypothetical protein [Streptomyces beijiangensis]